MKLRISSTEIPSQEEIIHLYKAHGWSAAEKPQQLTDGLIHSHSLITAWDGDRLVGLGNAISDGHLVVYYPHLLVDPGYIGKGIGRMIVNELSSTYKDFHMQMLTADSASVEFYLKMGFEIAGSTQSMWKYTGKEHE